LKAAEKLIRVSVEKGLKIAVAESCTGGMVSAAITAIPGSSKVFDCGFITYSPESKIEILNVLASVIKENGTVSEEVAAAMVMGAIKNSHADIAISITGIAGPGSEADKPVGLVYFGVYCDEKVKIFERIFPGDRAGVRTLATEFALELLLEVVGA
jgi:PncC family amidohydrolase